MRSALNTALSVLFWTIAATGTGAWAQATPPATAEDPLPRAAPEDVGLSSARLARIADVLSADIAAGRMPGAVIAIARRGKLAYFEAFGWRDKSAGVRMTTDTIFNIASMTKPLTTVAALALQEQGKLLIDDRVAQYFPQFGSMQVAQLDTTGDRITGLVAAARPITIRDLLTHTSGLIYGGRGSTAVHKLYPAGSAAAAAELTGPEFLDKLAGAPLLWQPGSTWDYGFGLDVTGQIIERITHQSLGAYLQQAVFAPLGMSDTGFLIPPEKAARYAKALPTDPETGKPQTLDPDSTREQKFECGGGCAVSTAADYLRFASMLLGGGELDGKRILGRKTVQYMTSNQLSPSTTNLIYRADPTRADYGFGLGLAVRRTEGVVRLLGSVGDFSWPGASGTNWWVDPREQLVVVFMAHTPGTVRWHYREMINALVYQAVE
ncbi:MAG: beta-lactamase family protein [Acidisphaera sp.]|nr:beta-lactamase family protein [Acidisphaera sp.]